MANPKIAYKPRISGNQVCYRNTKGQSVTRVMFASLLPQALSKAVTGKTPNVTQYRLEELVWDCSEHLYNNNSIHANIELQRAEKLIEHYGQKNSEGEGIGIITQKEQFEMMEKWDHWYGFDKE